MGVNIPENKKTEVALTYIYGVGLALAQKILKHTKIDVNKKAKDLSQEEVNKIQDFIRANFKVEGELRQFIKQNITLLKEMQSYRGIRHIRHLPVHGQRTKTNSRTVRGNIRKTAGSGKRKVELK